MGKKTPAPPPAPDYSAAAQAQGQANLQAGLQTAGISNPNIISPYGNQTVTWDMSDPNMPKPTITQTLTPDAQAALNSQQRVQREFADLGSQGIGAARDILGTPFQYTGPDIQTSFDQGRPLNYGPTMGEYGTAQGVDLSQFGQNQGVDETQFGRAGTINANAYGLAGGIGASDYGLARGQLDLSNVARMPVNAGMTGQQAILSRLAPQLERQREGLRTQLLNQGLRPGTEAFARAMEQQGQQENDLLTQAALQGINVDMSANQQGFGQAAQTLGLYNQAVGQNFGQGLSAQQLQNAAVGQNYGQGLSSQQLGNAAIAQNQQAAFEAQRLRNDALNANIANAMQGQAMQNAAMQQNYGQAANLAGLYNSAAAQNYNQNMQAAQFGNTASDQALARALQLRNQPLNEITALMGASQIQNPQFQGYTGANVSAAPVYQAASDQAKYGMDVYGQKMAARNANMAALGSVAGAGMGMIQPFKISDMRLKSNIQRVGTHANGVGVYEYDIDGHRERGVMAQEVLQVKPEAVTMRDDGFYMVDYGAL
jgi:hypothetical protein